MRNLLISLVLLLCISINLAAYSRAKAVEYAKKWARSANHKCGSYDSCTPASYWGSEVCGYSSHGGDCANFVSQCLYLGGGHGKLTGGSCRGYPCGWEEVGAKRLADCLKEKGWTSTCGKNQKPPSNIAVGDVLIYSSDGCGGWDAHATLVTVAGTSPKITCHSSVQVDASYTYLSNSKPYYNWLHYNGK